MAWSEEHLDTPQGSCGSRESERGEGGEQGAVSGDRRRGDSLILLSDPCRTVHLRQSDCAVVVSTLLSCIPEPQTGAVNSAEWYGSD